MSITALDWNAINTIAPFMYPYVTETALFDSARYYSNDYTGGQWDALTIGEYTFAIPPEGTYKVINGNNYFNDSMDRYTYGVAITLMVYNKLLWRYFNDNESYDERWSDVFYAMKNCIEGDRRIDMGKVYSFLD